MNEVVNGIAGRDGVELAVIPRGTGGDFVRTFGIPHELEEARRRRARAATTRTIDLGRATYRTWAGDEASAWFANIASAGMSGAVAQARERDVEGARRQGRRTSGRTLAVFAALAERARSRVTVDGEERRGPMYDVIVANGRYLGGGMKIAPDAEPDDGLFDVLLIGDVTKRDLVATMPKIYRGTHLPHPKAELLRGATVAIDAPSRFRSSSTASSRARRRSASRSFPGLCGCACPRPAWTRAGASACCVRASRAEPWAWGSWSGRTSSASSPAASRSSPCRRACRPASRAP